MPKLSENEAKKVADLIKIKISEAELKQYAAQLEHALDAATQLSDLNTDNAMVLSHPTGLTTAGSDDRVEPSLGKKILQNAEKSGNLVLDYIKITKTGE